MTYVHTITYRFLIASLLFCSCFAAKTLAQTPAPSPESKPTQQEEKDPFAPDPPE
jgi:hypothetical protein